jgi:hypothetical protein
VGFTTYDLGEAAGTRGVAWRACGSNRESPRRRCTPSSGRAQNVGREQHEVRARHVSSRPPSTGIAHYLRAGEADMRFIACGARRQNDICYYPRSNKIYWRGVRLIARLEPLDYDDGEPED